MNKIALITGATSGIGEATAIILAKNGYNTIITGRRKEKLAGVKGKIESTTDARVLALNFDVRNFADAEAVLGNLPDQWQNVEVLVNNAGLASGFSTVQEGALDDWERMIDTNIKGLLYVTRIVSPWMVKRGSGHIINISSIAGKETYPMGNVYCATKHAVQSITKGMRLDMLKHGIKVGSVCPGAVDTEFSTVRFHGDKQKADNVYHGFSPLRADDVAETILFMLTRPKHVNIDDILIMPTDQAFSRDFNRKEID